jgi:hypothetical protein
VELLKTIQRAIDARKEMLLLTLQGLTALGVILTIALMIHVGPLTLFTFMTVAQGLILVSLFLSFIILITQKQNILHEHFGPGQIIFRKGDVGDKLYIVVHGEMEVVGEETGNGETIIAKLGAGDCFGEMALVRDDRRMATVRSRTGVSLISLDRQGFQALFTNLLPLRKIFEQMMEERSGSGKRADTYPRSD